MLETVSVSGSLRMADFLGMPSDNNFLISVQRDNFVQLWMKC